MSAARFESRLRAALAGRVAADDIHVFVETDSTIRVARELHAAGCRAGALVVAGRQTAGQGRHGRAFVSPEGGLYATLLAAPPADPALAWRYGFAAALAARETLAALGIDDVLFDWPNDLVRQGRKVGGILLDLRLPPGRPGMVLVSLGLNLGPDPSVVAPELAGPAAPLPKVAAPDARVAVVSGWLERLQPRLDDCRDTGRWRDVLQSVAGYSLAGRGHFLSVRRPDGSLISGQGVGLGEDGSLILRVEGGETVAIRYGERC